MTKYQPEYTYLTCDLWLQIKRAHFCDVVKLIWNLIFCSINFKVRLILKKLYNLRAGCGLKIGTVNFSFNFCICNIHGIPDIIMWGKKPIPHSDYSETKVISKYSLTYIVFLYEINRGKRYFSRKILKKLMNDICMRIVFILEK